MAQTSCIVHTIRVYERIAARSIKLVSADANTGALEIHHHIISMIESPSEHLPFRCMP